MGWKEEDRRIAEEIYKIVADDWVKDNNCWRRKRQNEYN